MNVVEYRAENEQSRLDILDGLDNARSSRSEQQAEQRQYAAQNTGDENTVFAQPLNDNSRYSISEIRGENGDYGEGVVLDTDLFEGVKPRDWGRVLGRYVYENMAGRELTMYDEAGRPQTVYLARGNDRVRKDGAKNSHKALDKLAGYRATAHGRRPWCI